MRLWFIHAVNRTLRVCDWNANYMVVNFVRSPLMNESLTRKLSWILNPMNVEKFFFFFNFPLSKKLNAGFCLHMNYFLTISIDLPPPKKKNDLQLFRIKFFNDRFCFKIKKTKKNQQNIMVHLINLLYFVDVEQLLSNIEIDTSTRLTKKKMQKLIDNQCIKKNNEVVSNEF